MIEIPLTRGQVALVDDDVAEEVLRNPWVAKISNHVVWYAARTETDETGRWDLYLHNLIMQPKEGEWVDHIDRNGLNCLRSNMRITTFRNNMLNRRHWSQSGYRGVYPDKGRWRAMIRINSRLYHLGTFITPEEAALAYDKAATEHNGEFAELNFPTS